MKEWNESIDHLKQNKQIYVSFIVTGVILFVLCYISYHFVNYLIIEIPSLFSMFHSIFSILKPLFYGIILAYFLHPIVVFFERILFYSFSFKNKQLVRAISIVLAFITVLSVITILIYSFYLMINGSIQGLNIERLNETLIQFKIQSSQLLNRLKIYLESMSLSDDSTGLITNWIVSIQSFFITLFQPLIRSISNLFMTLFNLFLGVLFSIYILGSKEYLSNLSVNTRILLFKERRVKLIDFLKDVDRIIKRYLRVLFIDLSLMSLITWFFLFIIGYPFGFILAVVASYFNVIPYVGGYIGALPALFVGMATSGFSYGLFGYIYIVVISILHSAILSPKIQGDGSGIHPFILLIGITFFGSFFGVIGMLLAVPLTAIAQLIIVKISLKVAKRNNLEFVPMKNQDRK